MGVMEKLDGLTSAGAREYLTFRLDQEEYGIDILKVQEIRGYEPPTRVADAPNFIKGVVNLRGTIVPIVDMRLKFNCANADYNTFTVVIVLNLRNRIVGIVVDSVSDVMELPPENLKPAPDLDSGIDSGAVLGLGSLGDRMLILLDIERLMSASDMGLVSASD
ncbi:MAG: chemotaxis protein CheW [Burkholderiales bacterium]|jgi:purine-binding chemotaxis protein CheW|nr:chemotaxis protein CheW [Burkholderiales bacterium]MBK9346202.1 chemotaxis protein CheW [Burkholderiales bacterium]